MRIVLLLLVFALPAASVSGAELFQHRGIWLHPEQFKTPQLADEWIAKLAAARLNAIYPLVWYRGGVAWFKSQSCPMAEDVPDDFDPLGYLVTAAHARGIDVHPWFVNGSYGAPVTTGLFVQHPEWRLQGGRGDRPCCLSRHLGLLCASSRHIGRTAAGHRALRWIRTVM